MVDLDPTSTGTGPHDKSKSAPRLDPPNTGSGILPGPGVNSGSATNSARSLAGAATKVEVERQERGVGLLKSACGSLYHNLFLIACYDRNLLLFLNNLGLMYVDLLVWLSLVLPGTGSFPNLASHSHDK